MLHKTIRSFDASVENAKELRGDLANIGQKVDAHAISIKHLELKIAQLSSTVNPRQSGTLPRNTVKNAKNDRHCMRVTTQGVKKNIDPTMMSGVKDRMRGDDKVVEVSGQLVEKS